MRKYSLGDLGQGHMLRPAVGLRLHQQPEIRGIREQPPFARFDWVGQPFAREDFVFQHAKAAAVERQRTRVLQPNAALVASS